MAELKRKRSNDEEPKSNKKRATQAPNLEIKVKLLKPSDEPPLVIGKASMVPGRAPYRSEATLETFTTVESDADWSAANTPGFQLPQNMTFEAYEKTSQQTPRDRRIVPPRHVGASSKPPELLLHSSSHPKLQYIAREEQDGSADSHLKHYIAVMDPATRELKLMEVPKLVIRSVPYNNEDEDEESEKEAKPTVSVLAARESRQICNVHGTAADQCSMQAYVTSWAWRLARRKPRRPSLLW